MTKKNGPSQTKQTGQADPHAAREADKYQNPIPSREFILDHLEQHGSPLTHPELAHALNLEDADNVEALRRRLIAMARDGQLVSNRRGQFIATSAIDLVKGCVIGHRDGFGFVKKDDGGDDLYLSARQMQTVFDGDRVLVRVDSVDPKGKGHAVIIDVLERNTSTLVGRLFKEGGTAFVEVENVRIAQQVMIPDEAQSEAKHGQYVVIEITHQPSKKSHASGKVIEVLGDHLAPGMEIEVAIRSHSIPFEWPEEVAAAAAQLTPEVSEADKQQRIDLRKLPLVTIDGEDARDFDDAVYCEPDGTGWRLYVAIADVSHYVQPEQAFDKEAHRRGTSVYFPDHVVPMLPEVLSNGLCSLNPKVDRLAMVCEMRIAADGVVSDSCFYEAVIHSHARLTYNQVGTLLEQPDSSEGIQLAEDYASLLSHLHQLYALYDVLKTRRQQRGAIDFDTVETQIIFGDGRKIEAIVPTQRNDAHKIIEECMLCANVATAEFLAAQKIPSLYRIHEAPGAEKLENLRSFLSELGLQLMGGDSPEPADYQSLMAQIKERPDFSVIQTVMLRSMSQAVYGPEEAGHFGLAYEHYAHFTSPIRRYPDLLTHRAIKSVIYSRKPTTQVRRPDGLVLDRYSYRYDVAAMVALGEHCSMAERRADEATRDVVSWLKCEYLQQHLGEVFSGLISGVTGFGFFVELADLYVEGLVHIANLDGDYYQYDAQKHRLVGERTGTRYGLGDRVMVQVARISLEERKVDLVLVSAEPRSKARRRLAAKNTARGAKRNDSKASKATKRRSAKSEPSAKPAGKQGAGGAVPTKSSEKAAIKKGKKSSPKAKRPSKASTAEGRDKSSTQSSTKDGSAGPRKRRLKKK